MTVAHNAIASIVYVTNAGNNTVRKYDSTTGADLGLFANVDSPNGIAYRNGFIYVASRNTNSVKKIDASTGAISNFANTGSQPLSLAFDASGNLFVGNLGSNSIQKITPGGTVSTFISGGGNSSFQITAPYGLGFSSTGFLYVSDNNHHNLYKFDSSGVRSTVASGLGDNQGLTMDASDNVFVANTNNQIRKFTPAGVASVYATDGGLSGSAFGLAFDTDNSLLVTKYYAGSGIRKISSAGVGSTFTTSNTNFPNSLVIVPEPASLGLLVLGGIGMLRRR